MFLNFSFLKRQPKLVYPELDTEPCVDRPIIPDRMIAFEATLTSESHPDSAREVIALTPDVTLNYRLSPDAIVYLHVYRSLGLHCAVRCLQFHGALRGKVYGDRFDFTTIDVKGMSNRQVLRSLIDLAREVVAQLENPTPTVATAIEESKPQVAAVTPEPGQKVPLETVGISGDFETLPGSKVFEGVFMSMAQKPFRSEAVKYGRIATTVELEGQLPLYGSDLQRAMRLADAIPGDKVRLIRTKVRVVNGNNVVVRNHWDCELVEKGQGHIELDAIDARRKAQASELQTA